MKDDRVRSSDETGPRWVRELAEEDLQFIKRFILASGSLKAVAREYGISYPTVRLRLDRLIEKVRILDEERPRSAFHRTVRLLVAEGQLDLSVARRILRAHEAEQEENP